MWATLAKVGVGLAVAFYAIGRLAWGTETAVGDAGTKKSTTKAGGDTGAAGLSCDAATKAVPKELQDHIATIVSSGNPTLIDALATELDKGVADGSIQADVGKKIASCLRAAKGVDPLAKGPAAVKLTGPTFNAAPKFMPTIPVALFPSDSDWPTIQALPDNTVALGSKYNWRPTIMGLLAGIDYPNFMAGNLVGNGKRPIPAKTDVSAYMALMQKDPVLQAKYSGLGGVLPMALVTLNAVYDKLAANGY